MKETQIILLIEVLEKTLQHFHIQSNKFRCVFLCHSLERVLTNYKSSECSFITKWFKEQKPTVYVNTEFTEDGAYTGTHAWWLSDELKQRRKFIKHLIEQLKAKL
jgi:hypothetical protein